MFCSVMFISTPNQEKLSNIRFTHSLMYDNKNLEVEFHFGRTSGLILKLGIELETVGIKYMCVCVYVIYMQIEASHTHTIQFQQTVNSSRRRQRGILELSINRKKAFSPARFLWFHPSLPAQRLLNLKQ